MSQRLGARSRSKTRENVLEVSLALFNEHGIDRVTTAEIAAAAGINEGNLYYYFQKKEQLLLALFELFAAALVRAAEYQISNPADPRAYEEYQRGWFGLMWDYRFFYRDGAALRAIAPGVRTRVASLTERGQAEVRRVFRQMRDHGFMRFDEDELAVLIANIWIVSSYWMDYRLQGGGSTVTPEDLVWGFRQVEMIVRPYMTEAGLAGRVGF